MTATVGDPLGERDIWNVCYIGDAKVGYQHVTVRPARRQGQDVLSIDGLVHLAVKRFRDDTTMEIRYHATETPGGQLVDFQTTMSAGTEPQITTGQVADNRLRIQMGSSDKAPAESIPWSDQYGGFLAVERSLWSQPMKPGERRELKALVPGPNQVGQIELSARDFERVKLLGGTYELLRIESVVSLSGKQSLAETLWVDRAGEIQRRKSDAMNLESFRASQAVALDESQQGSLDLGESLSVKVDRPLDRPHDTQRVRYQVHWKDGDPSALFVAGPSQQIKPVDPHTAIVTVYALRPGQPAQAAAGGDDPPTEADRRANSFIQSDDPEIVALAQQVAGSLDDPWQVALALEQHVGTVITQKGYTQAFATASEVLKTHTGDCTEHAVLLAALARARGIPARVAMGLVYMPGHQAFAYHMWTEVFVHGQWIGIDGTLARGGIGAAHLKLAHHSLEGTSAYSTFLPIAQVAGKLQIDILGDTP